MHAYVIRDMLKEGAHRVSLAAGTRLAVEKSRQGTGCKVQGACTCLAVEESRRVASAGEHTREERLDDTVAHDARRRCGPEDVIGKVPVCPQRGSRSRDQ